MDILVATKHILKHTPLKEIVPHLDTAKAAFTLIKALVVGGAFTIGYFSQKIRDSNKYNSMYSLTK